MKTLLVVCFLGAALVARAQGPALRLSKTIPLPGVSGRFDHFAVDLKNHRLFVAALGNNTIEVVDLAEGKRLKTLTGLRTPQGVAYLSSRDQIVVASGGDGTVKIFNGKSYILENTLSKLDDADNVRVDETEKTIYVGYGDGALALIDTTTGKQTGDIKLSGHPESFQLEQSGGHIFVNVPGAKRVAVVAGKSGGVVATWPMTEFHSNFPMAIDEANHRLFIGCRRPSRLVVLDTQTGKTVSDLEIPGDTDDLFYDSARKQLYVSCGDGFVEVIVQQNADTYKLRERVPTSAGARTAFFSPDMSELCVAVPLHGNQTAEIRVFKVN